MRAMVWWYLLCAVLAVELTVMALLVLRVIPGAAS